jgi:hypothetical protein
MSGIILLSFPIAIFGTNFHQIYTKQKEKKENIVQPELSDIDKKIENLGIINLYSHLKLKNIFFMLKKVDEVS